MRALYWELVLFLRSINSFCYIPENESEQPVLGWNTSNPLSWWDRSPEKSVPLSVDYRHLPHRHSCSCNCRWKLWGWSASARLSQPSVKHMGGWIGEITRIIPHQYPDIKSIWDRYHLTCEKSIHCYSACIQQRLLSICQLTKGLWVVVHQAGNG